jgi:hypothetical protein
METEENKLIIDVKSEYIRVNKHERFNKNRNDFKFLTFICEDIIINFRNLKSLYEPLIIEFVGMTLHHAGIHKRYYNLAFNIYDSKNFIHHRKNNTYKIVDNLSYDTHTNEEKIELKYERI